MKSMSLLAGQNCMKSFSLPVALPGKLKLKPPVAAGAAPPKPVFIADAVAGPVKNINSLLQGSLTLLSSRTKRSIVARRDSHKFHDRHNRYCYLELYFINGKFIPVVVLVSEPNPGVEAVKSTHIDQ